MVLDGSRENCSDIPIVLMVVSSNQLPSILPRRLSSSYRSVFPKLGKWRSACHSRTPSENGPSCHAAWVINVWTSSRRNESEVEDNSLAMFNHCKRGPPRKLENAMYS